MNVNDAEAKQISRSLGVYGSRIMDKDSLIRSLKKYLAEQEEEEEEEDEEEEEEKKKNTSPSVSIACASKRSRNCNAKSDPPPKKTCQRENDTEDVGNIYIKVKFIDGETGTPQDDVLREKCQNKVFGIP